MTYTLTLTDEQAEILGYALTKALRLEREVTDKARARFEANCLDDTRRIAWHGGLDRLARIEEVRCLLDACPAS